MADEKPDQFTAVAAAGFDRSGSFGKIDVLDEYQPELRGRAGRRTLRQMTNDETIGSVMFALHSFFRGVEWFVDPCDDDELDAPQRENYAKWAEDTLFNDLGDPSNRYKNLSWDDFIINAFSSLEFGWAYFDVPVYKKSDGTIGIADLMLVTQETLDGWKLSDDGHDIVGLYQKPPVGATRMPSQILIERERAIHFIASPYKSSPEGRSSFRHIYTPWYYKRKLMAIEAILAERGTGFPIAYVDASVKQAADANDANAKKVCAFYEDLVKNIKRNSQSGAVVYASPYKTISKDGDIGWTNMRAVELKFETPSVSNSGDVDVAIKRYDASIARGLLATFLMLGTDGKGGSLSLGQDQSNLFLKAISGWLEMFATVVNRQLIPMLWDLNGFPEEYMPYVRPGDLTQKTMEQVAAYIKDLAAAGIMVTDSETEDYLREFGGLPKREEGAVDLPAIPTEDGATE